jgi:hypothetical protein
LLSGDSFPLSSIADVLAWESTTDDVNRCEVSRSTFSDVGESLRVGKVLLQDSATVGVNFNLPYSSNSCSLEAKIESSNA